MNFSLAVPLYRNANKNEFLQLVQGENPVLFSTVRTTTENLLFVLICMLSLVSLFLQQLDPEKLWLCFLLFLLFVFVCLASVLELDSAG